jgi:hypothetical protein
METGGEDAGAMTNADRAEPQVRMVDVVLRCGPPLLLPLA